MAVQESRKVVHTDIKLNTDPALASRFLDVPSMPWEPTKFPGIQIKVLYADDEGRTTALFKLAPGAVVPLHEHTALEQTYVLEGSLVCGEGVCRAGEFVWRPAGSRHEAWAGPEGGLMLGMFQMPNRFFEADGRAVDGIAWLPYAETVLAQAAQDGKPVVIDFSADWCLPCKELEHKTFNTPEVIDAAEGFVPLKADLTQHGSPEVRALRRKFDIRGVPTIVFIDAAGRERANLRAVEFIDKEEFLSRLSKLSS